MKNIALIYVVLLGLTSFQVPPKVASKGESYHVMASSGLKMRLEPSLKGKKILTIPYNGEVERIDDNQSYGQLTVTELGNFEIKGEWVKVRYKGQEGFVFDGYLTQFPMPSGSNYLENDLKVSKDKYDIKNYTDCEPKNTEKCECGWSKQYYDNKVTYTYSYCSEEIVEEYVIFEGITFTEAYLIYKASGDIKDLKYDEKAQTITGESEGEEAGLYSIEIKAVGPQKYQFSMTSSC